MKTLVLITSQFPFGPGESFIGAEYPILAQSFDKILIISQNVTHEKTRVTSGTTIVYRYNPSTSILGFLYLPFLLLVNLSAIFKLLGEECDFRKKAWNRLTLKNFAILIKKTIKAVQLRDFIRKTLLKEGISESIIFYSYWLKTGAHAIAMLDYRGSIKIARAHGSDVYEEKTEAGYLPLLRFTAVNLDALFFASKDGKEYFEKKLNMEKPGFLVSSLGVNRSEFDFTKTMKSNKFVIVSCSNMIPLKRIDLVIHALADIKSDKEIEWLHFGDGILKKELSDIARKILGPLNRITYKFMGYYPNEDLLKFYSANQIDLFINTSSTEGIPVSIMEAQCFGVPVIATDTGGVKEVVIEGTGSLLPVNFSSNDLTKLIEYYSGLTEKESEIIRLNAMRNWESNFNATSNYKEFIMKVNSILASAKLKDQSLLL